jgi:Parvulin-like peptidyl-prolyl isomerase
VKTRKAVLAVMVLALATSLFAATATINQPAATVNLIRNKVISYQELNEAIAAQGATDTQALQVLDILINNEVFLQGAERDGVKVTDAQVNQIVSQQKASVEQQAGQKLTQEQFEQVVNSQYGTMDNFRKVMKEQYILQAYLIQEKGSELDAFNPDVTDAEISSYYRKNQTSFTQAENVKLAHIYIEKTGDAKTDAANKAKLETACKEIQSGKTTFEAAVNKYSEDNDSKSVGGEIGWLTADNTVAYQGWGETFCDTVMSLPVGEVSSVLESNTGYHIVRISVHNDAKLLTLNDRLSPEVSTTVREYIREGLSYQKQQIKIAELLNEMVASLRSQAKIRILYK